MRLALSGGGEMADPIERVYRLAQQCVESVPVIVVGSGASMGHGLPGMWELAQYLVANVDPTGASKQDSEKWEAFKRRLEDADLETALTDVPLGDVLTSRVVRATWKMIAEADQRILSEAINNWQYFPFSRLLQVLFRSNRTRVDVVTTNYDKLIEYAYDMADLCHFTGFSHGVIRSRYTQDPVHFCRKNQPARTVNIWKVHGSLDWFDKDNIPLGLPIQSEPYDGFEPIIVTPGIEKHRKTQQEPFRTILAEADNALVSAESYLCVGYGFNDEHIQPKLIVKCRSKPVPITIITKELTKRTRQFLREGAFQRFLAIEEHEAGSIAYSHEAPEGIILDGIDRWSLPGFLEAVE